jgi:hypothetical protein
MTDTATFPLVEGAWTSLGTGPAMVGAVDGDLFLVSAATQPSPASIGFLVHCAGAPVNIAATDTLWARACMPGSTAVIQQ